jgi:hypothetical protein
MVLHRLQSQKMMKKKKWFVLKPREAMEEA